jgi:hypothetical protein
MGAKGPGGHNAVAAARARAGGDATKKMAQAGVLACSSTAFTTYYRGRVLRRRCAMRKTSSTAQRRQGRGRTATSMRTTALAPTVGRSARQSRASAVRPQRGGGGGFPRALAVYKPPILIKKKSKKLVLRISVLRISVLKISVRTHFCIPGRSVSSSPPVVRPP